MKYFWGQRAPTSRTSFFKLRWTFHLILFLFEASRCLLWLYQFLGPNSTVYDKHVLLISRSPPHERSQITTFIYRKDIVYNAFFVLYCMWASESIVWWNPINFRYTYLRVPEELNNERLHFWTFQTQGFPTRRHSSETNKSRRSYDRLMVIRFIYKKRNISRYLKPSKKNC